MQPRRERIDVVREHAHAGEVFFLLRELLVQPARFEHRGNVDGVFPRLLPRVLDVFRVALDGVALRPVRGVERDARGIGISRFEKAQRAIRVQHDGVAAAPAIRKRGKIRQPRERFARKQNFRRSVPMRERSRRRLESGGRLLGVPERAQRRSAFHLPQQTVVPVGLFERRSRDGGGGGEVPARPLRAQLLRVVFVARASGKDGDGGEKRNREKEFHGKDFVFLYGARRSIFHDALFSSSRV